MPGPIIRVEGAAQLARQFRDAGGAVRDLSAAYREVARSLVPPAKREAPVGKAPDPHPGRLRDSTRGLGQRTRAILAAGSRSVPYAGPIHWGNPTAKTYPAHKTGAKRSTGTLGVIHPNPWLYRTADHRRAEVLQAFDDNVGAELRRYGLASPL